MASEIRDEIATLNELARETRHDPARAAKQGRMGVQLQGAEARAAPAGALGT